ncbi:MAG: 2,5-dichloro-2,5-cyclohexadiene-1,4-diol dehydrogenase [Chroococcidiopsis sp. SAG 2025]|uniref:glucose 1-dehydrogenase n=1 Tax=Chroococcidiopsis sp. SAG 2025 TaxID=171389 RepID=UPI002936DFE9|nr:glucose 1-dehydrogenase [Chroococcidiopsis sp. SAG 2025]MDV2996823.1 2,5-dichloro-2,5-cyclohexadiene-1,4-diol dehydrogenase [Chroococcidiopsis sp. SAG 2025]
METKENNLFKDKVAFITGGGTGIGLATALAFAKEGASVVIVGSSDKHLEEGINRIKQEGGEAIAIKCDVRRAEDVKAALDQTIETYGRLDYAFNNAGVDHPGTPLADITESEFDRQMNINLKGVFLGMKYQIPLILKSGGGAIVNTSSGAGVKGFKGQAAYTAVKHGVIGLTRSAALDYATDKIRINVVAPGIIDTPMMDRFTGGTEEGRKGAISQEPIGRAGTPEEIADAVIWLCSDASSFVTGHALVADGGQTV